MPAAYAHLSFGRHVLRTLSEGKAKSLILQNQALFEIGLQGPDILFFYHPLSHHPVNRIGHSLHENSAAFFLDRPICQSTDDRGLSYLLGFICHYTLDSECHTLVEYYMEQLKKGHSEIETDLERELMTRDCLDARRHVPADCIQNQSSNAAVIAPFYGVDTKQVKAALTTMKLVSRTLTPSNRFKHAFLVRVGKLMGERSIVSELTMDLPPNPIYAASNQALASRLEQAVPTAIALMDNFLAWHSKNDTLSQRFQPTFSFDPEELARLKGER